MKIRRVIVQASDKQKNLDKVNGKISEPFIPRLHFNTLLISPRNSGKTNLMVYLILEAYNGIFNDIFIFSPTVKQCELYSALKIDDEKLFEEYSDEYLQSILDYQREPGNEKNNVLIIFDDCMGMFSKNSLFNDFITRTRHDRISTIVCMQYSKGILPIVRENMNNVIVFNNVKPQEIEKISDILDPKFDLYYKQLKGMSKYNFIYYSDKHGLMFNFDNLIYDDEDNPHIPDWDAINID